MQTIQKNNTTLNPVHYRAIQEVLIDCNELINGCYGSKAIYEGYGLTLDSMDITNHCEIYYINMPLYGNPDFSTPTRCGNLLRRNLSKIFGSKNYKDLFDITLVVNGDYLGIYIKNKK